MNLTSPKTIKHILSEYQLSPNKTLGQHFIIDDHFAERLVALADIQKNDIIVEVGPGLGAITRHLISQAKQVIAIEADRGLHQFLKDYFRNTSNLTVINQDALEISGNELPEKYKLVSNLPYQITSPFLEKFLWKLRHRPLQMALGVQKEVAHRLAARPPDMNRLAVLTQALATVQKHGTFSPASFYPQPQVSTSIVGITPNNIPDTWMEQTEELLRLAQAGFNQKRKKLIKSLEPAYESDQLRRCWNQLEFNANARPQELTLKQWTLLARCLQKNKPPK